MTFLVHHAAIGLACWLLVSVAATATETAGPPNVLFIAVDDLNDWVTCLGGRKGVHTPNLDRLAARGMLFTNAHCAAPACNPSRVAVMTGVRPSTSGVYHNVQSWRQTPRLAEAVTLPEHFRSNGYVATGGGKIFHALSWITEGYGKQRNDPDIWDRYFPSKDKPMPDALWPAAAKVKISAQGYVNWQAIAFPADAKGQRPPHYFDFAPLTQPENQMADHQVVDWAIGELGRGHDKPFFLAVGLFRPHIPWFAPRKYFDLYPLEEVFLPKVQEGDLDDCGKAGIRSVRRAWHKWLVENDQWRQAVQGYLACISFADSQIGRLIDALDNSPCVDNTIIVLWSDHGMHIGEKEQWEKFTLWEESTRVPLIVVAPGVTKAESRCGQPVSLVDVYPTLIELCGLPNRNDIEGTSLVELLRNPSANRAEPAITTWGQNNHAIRTDRWRYIRYGNGEEELYDHRSDGDEFTNLVVSDPAGSRPVIKELARWLPTINADPAPVQ
jgi:arylsulfatase A-like enzyme